MIAGLLARFGLPAATPWILLGLVIAFGAVGGGMYLKGWADRAARCETAALEARVATLEADLEVSRRAAAEALKAEQNLNAAAQAANQRIAEYERTLQGRDVCALDQSDVERLRELGGPR